MNLNTTAEGSKITVEVEGRVDTTTSATLANELDEVIPNSETIILDLEKLLYISSAGLRILIASLKEVKAKDGSMTLINVSEGVREILDLTGFGLILDIQ